MCCHLPECCHLQQVTCQVLQQVTCLLPNSHLVAYNWIQAVTLDIAEICDSLFGNIASKSCSAKRLA